MDSGKGRFEAMESLDLEYEMGMRKKFPKSKGIFSVGEELEIKGSRFRVKKITPFGILLKLLKPIDTELNAEDSL